MGTDTKESSVKEIELPSAGAITFVEKMPEFGHMRLAIVCAVCSLMGARDLVRQTESIITGVAIVAVTYVIYSIVSAAGVGLIRYAARTKVTVDGGNVTIRKGWINKVREIDIAHIVTVDGTDGLVVMTKDKVGLAIKLTDKYTKASIDEFNKEHIK